MPSQHHWLIQKRVIYLKLYGDINLDDMQRGNQLGINMLDAGTPPIHVILDDEELKSAPVDLTELLNTLKVYRHPSHGWLLSVGERNTVGKYVSSLLAKIYGIQYHRLQSIQDALDFLREQDETLDWSRADYTVLDENVKP